jgi:hypothetical protein
MSRLIVLSLALLSSVRGDALEDTQAMRRGMEAYIKDQAMTLQTYYGDVVAMESVPACPHKQMCDVKPTSWTDAVEVTQFLDTDDSCVRMDLNPAGTILDEPVTGRKTYDDINDPEKCAWKQVDRTVQGEWELNDQTRIEYLEETGCIRSSEKGVCTVEMNNYGVSTPDAATASQLEDERLQAEICATNMLHDSMEEYTIANPHTGWHFLGLQETGLYRTSPAIMQCRTENQCSGW